MDSVGMRERWVKLKYKSRRGYEYSVSSHGNIRSENSGKLLDFSNKVNGPGYYTVSLGRNQYLSPHRLVCVAFHGNPPTKRHQVNHKDGNRLNNHYKNLEWVTPKQNIRHASKRGSFNGLSNVMSIKCRGSGNPKAKLNEKQVLKIRHHWDNRKMGQLDLAIKYRISKGTINQICNRKTWRHLD